MPYALRESIEKELEQLKHLKIIEKVNFSEWAAPVVLVLKPDGNIRLHGDYKVTTINPVLDIDRHPLPTPEDLPHWQGARSFQNLTCHMRTNKSC